MKRRNIMILMISLSLVLLLGSSYAMLRSTAEGKNPYVINVGTLQVSFEGSTEKLSLENMYPMSDEEGKNISDVLSFVVKNTGNVEARYNLYLEELSNTPVFKDHIRFIVKKNEHDYTDPKTLGNNKYIDANAYLDTNQTANYKVKLWLDREADNTYMSDEITTKEFKAKVVIEGIQNTNEYDLYDISGNNYNAKFMNGAKIITDENSRKAISFDGEDDYVDIDDLPATIDWESGFSVEFEAEWKALNYYSRIFDFANGSDSDNFLAANVKNTTVLNTDIRYDNTVTGHSSVDAIELNKILKFKIDNVKTNEGYRQDVYKNGILLSSIDSITDKYIKNILRTSNYLGKSNWDKETYGDENFNGLIYSFKMADSKGNPILWYDLNW